MPVKLIPQTPSACGFPLLIKNILLTPLTYNPDRVQIVETSAKTSVGKINKKQLRMDFNRARP